MSTDQALSRETPPGEASAGEAHPIRWGPDRRRPGLLERLHGRLAAQRHEAADHELAATLGRRWRESCMRLGLCEHITAAAATTIRTPRFGALHTGPAGISFTVELLPGGAPDDITTHADRLARALGAAGLRVEPVIDRWVRVVLHDPPTSQH